MSGQRKKTPCCTGLLAHVDAGKTTLSEAMLFTGGQLRKLGRVDHGNAFLDTDVLERERGITIFSKQAVLPLDSVELTLLDTPGHVDFSSEMERTLQVLDCAVLVISGTDGVQSHTRTLWKLLDRYRVPTFLFINKMDLEGADRSALLASLQKQLSGGCIDFSAENDDFAENVAMCDEVLLSEYLDTGTVPQARIQALIAQRRLFPCYFGSALKLEGVDSLLRGLERYARPPEYPEAFGAKVYKIAHDAQGARLTYLKVTGGSLPVKTVLRGGAGEKAWAEKADQLRVYSGSKFRLAEEIPAGGVCAVTGLTHTYPGEGLGAEQDTPAPALESFLTYQVILPEGMEPHTAVQKLRLLEEEDPQLHVVWNEQLREIHVQLMGEVQLEVLQRLLQDRFCMAVTFGPGNIVYRETIQAPVEGMGHFEPLRHYAEVHLLLEPGEPGSGLRFASACSEDVLDRSWQRLILTHLEERTFPGVLTGSPITDMKITLLIGRAHLKHTEGGDFRQATYRAVRHGLLNAESVLLEPWYDFRLEVPSAQVGRAIADLQRLFAEFAPPATEGGNAVITGSAPVSELRGYPLEVAAYTRGAGSLLCMPKGYRPCHNAEAVIAAIGYDAERDTENTGDSVFCSHGSGFVVRWQDAASYMHLESGWQPPKAEEPAAPEQSVSRAASRPAAAFDSELQAIFERTYGPIKRRDFRPQKAVQAEAMENKTLWPVPDRTLDPEYLLIDGYNVLYAWEDLKKLAEKDIDTARQLLMDQLCNYQSFTRSICILVFDAYRVPRDTEDVIAYHNIKVVFTKQAETADTYIERATYEIAKRHRVRVATSDGAEQMIVLGHGAQRMSANELKMEVDRANALMRETMEDWNERESARHANKPFRNIQ
ncbi:MAG: NYN domain-containing protein [Hominenteromicrobium sp.]